jgi:hypothetical protein
VLLVITTRRAGIRGAIEFRGAHSVLIHRRWGQDCAKDLLALSRHLGKQGMFDCSRKGNDPFRRTIRGAVLKVLGRSRNPRWIFCLRGTSTGSNDVHGASGCSMTPVRTGAEGGAVWRHVEVSTNHCVTTIGKSHSRDESRQSCRDVTLTRYAPVRAILVHRRFPPNRSTRGPTPNSTN